MPELKVLHFTDLHEDTSVFPALEAIAKKEKVNAIFHTGDFIGPHDSNIRGTFLGEMMSRYQSVSVKLPSHLEEFSRLIKKYQSDPENFSEEDGKELEKLGMENQQLGKEIIGEPMEQGYAKIRPGLEALAKVAPVYGVLGNWDLTPAYDLLGDIVKFADREEFEIEGKSGKKFKVKGANNTHENVYKNLPLGKALEPFFINYNAGIPVEKCPEVERPKLEKVNQAELERLSQTGPADILLAHKAHDNVHGSGNAVKEFAPQCGSVFEGHKHQGWIRMKNGKIIMNPGRDYAFAVSYDANKEIEEIDVYRVH